MGKYQDFYAKCSLPDLRRRQSINASQCHTAYLMAQGAESRNRGLKALIRLQRIEKLLTAAVYDKP